MTSRLGLVCWYPPARRQTLESEIDSIGRVLIPEFLRKYAGLKGKVVFAGVYDRVEIWNESSWEDYKSRNEKTADQMAKNLGDIGVF